MRIHRTSVRKPYSTVLASLGSYLVRTDYLCLVFVTPLTRHSPICSCQVSEQVINQHIDSGCQEPTASADAEQSRRGSGTSKDKRKRDSSKTIAPIFNLTSEPSDTFDRTPLPGRVETTQEPSSSKKRRKEDFSSSRDEFAKRTKTAPSNLRLAAPLAEQLRPMILDDYVGQKHLTGPGSLMSNMLNTGSTGSMILWGPPG